MPMTKQTGKPEWWEQAKKELSEADPVMAEIIKANPEGYLETRGNPFETLLDSVIGQQISVKAAANIWERFAKSCKEIKPEIISRKHRRTLRTAGLSERKIDYVFDICRFFIENPDAADGFQHRSNEEIIKELCTIKGVGPWTAEMFLIFALGRPDVAPMIDYGFIKAVGRAYFPEIAFEEWSAADRKEEMSSVIAKWGPWKTAGTWYLWRSLKNGPMQ